jgi:hypothetical protein
MWCCQGVLLMALLLLLLLVLLLLQPWRWRDCPACARLLLLLLQPWLRSQCADDRRLVLVLLWWYWQWNSQGWGCSWLDLWQMGCGGACWGVGDVCWCWCCWWHCALQQQLWSLAWW